ncbi:MAG: Brp/Blh family beta-carotene 15,15'-dioxygenase [Saprospiraceae bacterium]|nr:Brp/Blh family beta-carotene 15,15'-dioxygenase [Saprospiraceae bacterium]
MQLLSLESELIQMILSVICALGILSIGLAHGAIDNILYGVKSGRPNIIFIIKYVAIIGVFCLFWVVLPDIAFALFLGVSAYHFGQSQFVEYKIHLNFISKILYTTWGGVILMAMLHFNAGELLNIQENSPLYLSLMQHLLHYSYYYLIGVSTLYILSFSVIIFKQVLSPFALAKELYLLTLTFISFYLLPSFIAFSLFFVWVHSLRVITQEYEYCKTELDINNYREFIKLFIPLTVASLLGIIAVLAVIISIDSAAFIPYALLILLSCVTIPHSFVMEKFYLRFSSKT